MGFNGWAIAAIVVAGLIVLSVVYTKLTAPGFHVAGKHLFITGGNQGIGLAIAKKYAAAGANVTIAARNAATLEKARAEIQAAGASSSSGHTVCVQQCDVADFAAMQRAVETATAFHGRTIDHLICCAGISVPGAFAEQGMDVHRQVVEVNLFGTLHTIKAALPSMSETPLVRRRDRRRIVIVSSGLGLISWTGCASYSPSKYALRGLAEALRNELLLFHIDVSVFYPGSVDTPGNREQDLMRPKETEIIQGDSSMATADSAAQALVNGLRDGQFAITNEIVINLLRAIANGVAPRNNTPLEVLLAPLIVLVQLGYGFFMDFVVTRARDAKRRQAQAAPTVRTALM